MIVFFIFCALPCKCALLSYTSLTLKKLMLPKIQESFDPFFHTLPPTSSFLFRATTRLGRVEKGSGGKGTMCAVFFSPLFLFFRFLLFHFFSLSFSFFM